MAALDGKVVAIVCRGSEADRAIAVALAEAGADLALATISGSQGEEFATASIANEVWAIGREQFNTVFAASDPAAAASFAAEVVDRLGRCDAAVIATGGVPALDFDAFSADEWEPIAREGLTGPMIAAQALGRVIERGGGGRVVFVVDAAPHGDVAGGVIAEGQRAMAANMGMAWAGRGVRVIAVSRDGAPDQVVNALSK